MNKKIANNQVERLLDLVPYLTSNPGISIEQIAKDFKTSKSAIIDDLNTLWMCGLPGYTPLELIDLSFDTGFVTIRNAEVLSKPRKLSHHEAISVIVGLSILREAIPDSSSHHIAISELVNRISESMKIPTPVQVRSDISPEIRQMLQRALSENRCVRITHFSFNKDIETERTISPLQLRFIEGQEYLEAFCTDADEFRVFRLDRIRKVEITDDGLLANQNISEESTAIGFTIKILKNARQVFETFRITSSDFDAVKESYQCSAYNSDWIVRTIFSLKGAAHLTEPLELRRIITERARKALEIYK